MTTVALENVSKSFGPVKVIEDVSFTVEPGTVHVLLGENGAGKSTLIKMIAGIHQPDAGRVLLNGEPVTLTDPRAAERHGIATIHQELNLVPSLTVAENVLLGRLPTKGGLIDRRAMRQQAQKALDRIGLKVRLNRRVGELGIAQQQLIEIAKALSIDASVLILDEPTAALSSTETDQLFEIMETLKERGVAMIFISHHLDELPRIGDTVSVLRDGKCVAVVPASTEEAELVRLMVGRSIENQFPRRRGTLGETLLEVSDLSSGDSSGDRLSNISFSVRAGEVLGIAGLVGAGRTEVLRAIAGADSYDSGTVIVDGTKVPPGQIPTAIAAGLGLVPEDRKAQGLVLGGTVAENIGLATLFRRARAGLADLRGQRESAQRISEQLRIQMHSVDQQVKNLSGGNQQKVVFGRWALAESRVMLLDEPTRGVDVGAKVEIYQLINEVTENGGAVVMVSSELPEVLGMSDRIAVMSGGQITGELDASTATQDSVMTLAVKNVDDTSEETA